MAHALLTIAYIVLVVPAGVVARLLRDPMRRSWSTRHTTYWQDPEHRPRFR